MLRGNPWEHYIIVHYDNGDSIETKINATVPEIVDYYLDKKQSFSYGDGPETMATARSIEFLNEPMVRPWKGAKFYRQLSRVYSISEKYAKRHGLCNKFRCTVRCFDDFMPTYFKSDYAYAGQSFN